MQRRVQSFLLILFSLLRAATCRLTDKDKAFLLSYLGEDFSPLVSSGGSQPAVMNSSGDISALNSDHVDVHEHDHTHKERHHHKAKHSHSHQQAGRHIHRHSHHHNHKHNHDHGHDAEHDQGHQHSHTGDHKHFHQKKIVHQSKDWKRSSAHGTAGGAGHFSNAGGEDSGKVEGGHIKSKDPRTKDYHVASVEEYIGDSGKEFEGAAEQIVESYMGEYMQEYMQGWYSQYCSKTGQFCDQVKLKHSTKDKKTGSEIVYNVDSSSGYVPPSAVAGLTESSQINEDDINISYFHQQTTTIKPQYANALKEKRKTKLVDKLKKMFVKLKEKYKNEKKKIALAPLDFLKKDKPEKSRQESVILAEDQEVPFEIENSEYDEFLDFVPMEYEVVEDVIIENY